MTEKRYMIDDLQNVGDFKWWLNTKEDPMTEEEIIDMFWDYAQQDGMKLKKKDLNFDLIQDLWECEIIEVKTN